MTNFMVDPKTLEKLIWEARARVTWGDASDSIAQWLQEEGVPAEMIEEVLGATLKERDRDVRKQGLLETFVGGGILAVSAGATYFLVLAGGVNRGLFTLALCGCGFGGYRFMQGIIWLLDGKNVSGSVGDLGRWK